MHQVPGIDHNGAGYRRRPDPFSRAGADLKTANIILEQEGDTAVIGMGSGTTFTVFRLKSFG